MPSSKSRPAATDPLEDKESIDTVAGLEASTNTAGAEVATSEATDTDVSADGDGRSASTGWWRFIGAYPCAYTTPDRVSQWIQPDQIVAWPDGAPDTNWEPAPVPEPEPAPSESDHT